MLQTAVTDRRHRPRLLASPKPLAVSISDTSQLTGLGTSMIYLLIGAGRLKTVAIGRRRLVIYASIETLLQAA